MAKEARPIGVANQAPAGGDTAAAHCVLGRAQTVVEQASEFGERARNWEIQKEHEAEWALPAIEIMLALEPTSVLDLGCGYGTLAVAASLLGHDVVAVDWFVPSPAIPGVDWRRLNIQAPGGVPDGPFGIVIMTEVIEHLNFHPGQLLTDIRDRLCPSGLFIGAIPAPENWHEDVPIKTLEDMPEWSPDVTPVDAHIHFYSENELRGLLSDAGFDIRRMFLLASGYRRFWEASK